MWTRRSIAPQHVGGAQPNAGTDFGFNVRGVAPYWRVAWQQLTGKTQYEFGAYGMHMRSSPGAITGLEDKFTDWAVDAQIDRTLFRTDVLSLRGTYIRENSNLAATAAAGCGLTGQSSSEHVSRQRRIPHRQSSIRARSVGSTPAAPSIHSLYPQSAVSGSANGDPRGAGYIANFSYWPWQNLQLSAQYTGYTRFNGGTTNYDGAGRNASGNNTVLSGRKIHFLRNS